MTSNGTNPTLTIPLAGTATVAAGQLSATPATLAVGSVFVGASGTATGSLNATAANVTVTAASSNNSSFTISGLSLPAVITAGHSAAFTLTFSPQVAGAASATLTFTSNAQPVTTTAAATGTGTAAPTHSVSLSWSASSSPDISGYNIYRAIYTSSCGAYSKINGSTLDHAHRVFRRFGNRRHELLLRYYCGEFQQRRKRLLEHCFQCSDSRSINGRDFLLGRFLLGRFDRPSSARSVLKPLCQMYASWLPFLHFPCESARRSAFTRVNRLFQEILII